MKKLFIIFLAALSCCFVHAQNKVGIGTNTPHASAALDVSSTSGGLLIPRMTAAQRRAIPTPTSGLIVYQTNADVLSPFSVAGYYIYFGGIWKTLLDQDDKFWSKSGSRKWVWNNTDSIGIGTSSPDEKLHVVNGKIYLQDNRSGQNPFIIFDNPNTNFKEGGLQFKRSGDTLASIKYVNDPNLRNYIKISPQEGTVDNNVFISTNGTGIGTSDPQTVLHLRNRTVDEIVRLEGADPMIKFRNTTGAWGSYKDIGFLQTVNDDLRIGTFSSNSTGDFIIRTGGTDQVLVNSVGNVGIGHDAPFTKMHIVGGQDAGLSLTNNGYMMLGPITGTNIILDNNEIIARSGATTAATLNLQTNGGELVSGARLTVNKDGEAIKLNGVDPAINLYVNGVQKSYIWQTGNNLNIGVSSALGKIVVNTNQMLIGTSVTPPSGYKLGVGGKVICEELKVKLQAGGWPDYVFADDYKLPLLTEVEKFIQANKHLPNIPAASEVEKEGLEIGDMQKRMMEKLEELTLYIIQQQKEIEALKIIIKGK